MWAMLLPILMGLGSYYYAKKHLKPTETPAVPSTTTPQVIQSEEAIRKRLQQTGRGTTIFTGGLFDNPTSRKARLIPS